MTAAPLTEVAWKAHEGPQALLVTCPVPEVFYGGERGGGKSAGLLMDFAGQAQRYGKKARGILIRQSYPEFEELERQADEFYGPLGWELLKAERTWVAPNGASLRLRYLETEKDAKQYQGHAYSWIGVDEAGNWPSPKPLDLLLATLSRIKGIPCVRRLTGNPGGVGHLWLKQRYITPAPPGVVFDSEIGKPTVFIPSGLDDNPSLGEDYEREIRAATFGNEALWQAWRYGNWDVVAGAAFARFNRQVHVVPSRSTVPPGWKYYAGLDWGYAKGAAILAIGCTDRLEVIDAVELERMTAREAGEFLATRWRHVPSFEWIAYSPDMKTESGVGTTLRGEFVAGWNTTPRKEITPMMSGVQKPGSRHAKFVLTQEALAWDDDRDAMGNLRAGAAPYLVMQEKAKYLIDTLPALPVDPKDPNDVDTTADDHGYDALGFILAVARPPKRTTARKIIPQDRSIVSWETALPKLHPRDIQPHMAAKPGWKAPKKGAKNLAGVDVSA